MHTHPTRRSQWLRLAKVQPLQPTHARNPARQAPLLWWQWSAQTLRVRPVAVVSAPVREEPRVFSQMPSLSAWSGSIGHFTYTAFKRHYIRLQMCAIMSALFFAAFRASRTCFILEEVRIVASYKDRAGRCPTPAQAVLLTPLS